MCLHYVCLFAASVSQKHMSKLTKCLFLPRDAMLTRYMQWCIAKNGGGYTQRGVAKGLKVPCLFMITEVSIRCQKNPGGLYTPYTRVYPPIHHWVYAVVMCLSVRLSVTSWYCVESSKRLDNSTQQRTTDAGV